MARPPKCPLLDQGQEFIIFSNDCLDLSANLLIGNMVLVQNVTWPLIHVASHLKDQFLFSTSAAKVHDSHAYRNIGLKRECISFTFDPWVCFYRFRLASAL